MTLTPEEQELVDAAARLVSAQTINAPVTAFPTVPPVPAIAPVAEPGNTTSEYKLLAPATGIAGVAQAALALASAFGANLSAAQIAGVEGFVAAVVALYASYAWSRGVRKQGTQG